MVFVLFFLIRFLGCIQAGELYTWGRDEGDGRLGLGTGRGPNEAGGLSIPTKVKALPVSVAAVSCGGFFTMALSEEGQVWNWGGIDATAFVSFSILKYSWEIQL